MGGPRSDRSRGGSHLSGRQGSRSVLGAERTIRSKMMGRILALQDVEAGIRGGSVFAAGGGGWAEHGRMLGTAAVSIGQPELVSMDEVPDDAWIATAAAIGAPAGTTEWQMLGVDYVKAVEMLQDALVAPVSGPVIGPDGMSAPPERPPPPALPWAQ